MTNVCVLIASLATWLCNKQERQKRINENKEFNVNKMGLMTLFGNKARRSARIVAFSMLGAYLQKKWYGIMMKKKADNTF